MNKIEIKISKEDKVTPNNSVFIYDAGQSTNDYQHPEFVPVFSDSLSQAQLNEAVTLCGADNRECIYDYSVTRDASLALATRDRKETILARKISLSNSLPIVEISSQIKLMNKRWIVQENAVNVLQLTTTDADMDTVTVINLSNNTAVSLLPNGSLKFVPISNDPVRLSFQAKDARGGYSVVLNIPVTVCPSCSGRGVCDLNSNPLVDYLGGLFRVQRCICQPAFTDQQCNTTLTATSGTVMSPYFPLNYPDNSFCAWTILSNQIGAVININITEYEVESCPYDYLNIYDGNNTSASPLGPFCTAAPGSITSSGGAMHLVFVSDGSVTRKGFRGTYTIQNKCRMKNCSHSCEVLSTSPRVEQCVCPEWSRLDPNNSSRCLEINGKLNDK
uniref:CUB domain-containing protein n=1 Tax=Biomphalaria glabrata TaxID=6526 RepID=A0A2C9LKR9_BIOGL